MVGVLHQSGGTPGSDPTVLGICEYGYPYSDASEALTKAGHNPEEALKTLFTNLTGLWKQTRNCETGIMILILVFIRASAGF